MRVSATVHLRAILAEGCGLAERHAFNQSPTRAPSHADLWSGGQATITSRYCAQAIKETRLCEDSNFLCNAQA